MDELIAASACEIVARLKTGEVTPLDLLDALETRIAKVDTAVNALPTRCFERAREHATRLGDLAPKERGPLAGMPVPAGTWQRSAPSWACHLLNSICNRDYPVGAYKLRAFRARRRLRVR